MRPYSQHQPNESAKEYALTEALSIAEVPGEVLLMQTQPPPVEPHPPRFGYPTKALGLMEVMDVNRYYPDRRMDFSGSIGAFSGQSRNSLG